MLRVSKTPKSDVLPTRLREKRKAGLLARTEEQQNEEAPALTAEPTPSVRGADTSGGYAALAAPGFTDCTHESLSSLPGLFGGSPGDQQLLVDLDDRLGLREASAKLLDLAGQPSNFFGTDRLARIELERHQSPHPNSG